jgi:hypothetical protein
VPESKDLRFARSGRHCRRLKPMLVRKPVPNSGLNAGFYPTLLAKSEEPTVKSERPLAIDRYSP